MFWVWSLLEANIHRTFCPVCDSACLVIRQLDWYHICGFIVAVWAAKAFNLSPSSLPVSFKPMLQSGRLLEVAEYTLHGVLEYADLKFTFSGWTNKHTNACNAVTLVWCLLRLPPTILSSGTIPTWRTSSTTHSTANFLISMFLSQSEMSKVKTHTLGMPCH